MKVRKDLARRLGTLAFALSVIAGMTAALLLYLAFVQTAHRRVAEKLQIREGWTKYLFEDNPINCEHHGFGIPEGDIAVDTRGRVWVAWGCTRAGVSVYDGKNWTTYNPQNSELKSAEVHTLVVDPQGCVWIYGQGCFVEQRREQGSSLAIFDGQTWERLTARVQVNKLAWDRRGRIWIGGYSHGYPSVSTFKGTSLITYTPANSGLVNGSRTNLVVALAVDNQNRVWSAVDEGGVSVFDGTSWVTFSHDPMPFVTKIVFDNKGVAWLGTRSGGLVSYDGVKWTVHFRDTSIRGGYGGELHDITFDAQGGIWVLGSDRGIFDLRVYDGKKWTSLDSENTGMEGDRHIAIAADNQGRVWIVTEKAVNVAPQGWMPK
jgi:ligand-binding sensor domain-containing protein